MRSLASGLESPPIQRFCPPRPFGEYLLSAYIRKPVAIQRLDPPPRCNPGVHQEFRQRYLKGVFCLHDPGGPGYNHLRKDNSETHQLREQCRLVRRFGMNAGKGCLKITIVVSLVLVVVGLLVCLLSPAADEKVKGLATAVICPAVIWALYGYAFFPFKGFFSS